MKAMKVILIWFGLSIVAIIFEEQVLGMSPSNVSGLNGFLVVFAPLAFAIWWVNRNALGKASKGKVANTKNSGTGTGCSAKNTVPVAAPDEIVIVRKKAFSGNGKKYKVFLDDQLVGVLRNGETIRIKAIQGRHTLRFNWFKPEAVLDVFIQGGGTGVCLFASIDFWTSKIKLEVKSGVAGDATRIAEHQETAKDIEDSINFHKHMCEKAETVAGFIMWYDDVIEELKELVEMGAKRPEISIYPELDLDKAENEFQWHLCDAIDRSKQRAIKEIAEKYRNSVEFQKKCAKQFYDEVRRHKDRFSEGSLAFADKAIKEVYKAAREVPPEPFILKEEEDDAVDRWMSPVEKELAKIDHMEGHDFEYWCADLLRKVGFVNVKVTPGSGDQGVDVVAEKEGVRYAIQCKCYASDLGNSPVQEVFAGKEFYKCQVGVVMTNREFTPGAIQLAENTRVLLWGRTKLIEMIESEA